MEKAEIIKLVEDAEMRVVIDTYTVGYLFTPKRHEADLFMYGANWGNITVYSKNGHVVLNIEEKIAEFTKDLNNGVYVMNNTLMLSVVVIQDSIQKSNFKSSSPEFEFLRHLRNAVGHGNRFNFIKKEPLRPASFKSFQIDSSMHGLENVVPDYIGAGDILELLDFIKNNLVENNSQEA